MECINRVGLTEFANQQIGQLSGGQQQRTLLARALVQGADLLLLDEPMNAVDAETRMILIGVLDDLRAEGKTAIIATHDIGRLESDFDDVLFLADGHQVTAEVAFAHEHVHAMPAGHAR
jgi:manganese/zinc/iron transport system ATP- binding protein